MIIFLLYFSWCGPCKALTPRLENVIAKRNGKVTLAKVDIDSMGELAAKYEVKFSLYFVLKVIKES